MIKLITIMSENLSDKQKLDIIKENIKAFEDFPKPGIIFRDIFSVLADPSLFKLLHEVLLSHVKEIQPPVEYICGVDSRGFIFGSILAVFLRVPFIPIRKKGKLPGPVDSITYELEYGQDTLEIQTNIIKEGGRVLIVDDLLATGGTLWAAAMLISNLKAEVVECLTIIELLDLKGRNKIPFPVYSLIQF
ncbi:adenine phosphoribosyltransferase-like [Agrilus planipennis]|uniref:Adenine phosphoribosyltransferase n=1 Tax=Agrilus planipennis TaxID=224129 RepID=A0A7F5RBR4_AGRPL|nr:adenine phosphoribosyltransferase-like [Agrilus planipennis]XP_025833402.1 adenine phosphoribosyltransferase-like [Agrilus planipennis]